MPLISRARRSLGYNPEESGGGTSGLSATKAYVLNLCRRLIVSLYAPLQVDEATHVSALRTVCTHIA